MGPMRTRSEPPVDEDLAPPEGRTLGALRSFARILLRQTPRRAWIPPAGWALFIWLTSSLSLGGVGGSSVAAVFATNLLHAFEFGVLALLLVPLARRSEGWVVLDRATVGTIGGVAIAYGVLDEIHQAFVRGRHSSPFDVLTDAVGVFCTLKIVLYVSDHEATGRGLWGRLSYAVVLCVLAAGFATLGSS